MINDKQSLRFNFVKYLRDSKIINKTVIHLTYLKFSYKGYISKQKVISIHMVEYLEVSASVYNFPLLTILNKLLT